MKIILTTTILIALLASGIVGTNNSNSNSSLGNAFAQIPPENSPPLMEEDKSIEIMTMSTNQSEPMINWTGTIDVESTIGEAFKSKINVNMIDAIKAALVNVGLNSTVKEAELTPAHGYLIYKVMVVDEDMKKYKVIVDPGNGEVLMKKEITWCDEHEKMKYGDEKGNKYYHNNNMMMMEEKKY
jgi:uncharacterized membrane protein YkoI